MVYIMIYEKSNRAEQVKGGWVLPAQARKGGGSKMADSEPRPLLRVQEAKVALAKVSAASRKVRVQPHFDSSFYILMDYRFPQAAICT